ncbi:MAG TPA: Na+/H+ antiporter NhaA [Bdellovibrionales bacterium]|nr:Na+/H+ antiporter NhaA [Pseudobdellovibrionaceae bacterium]HAG91256.1 Na+/H+ antiporter NhaA [Bdellovibrionales bacterium]
MVSPLQRFFNTEAAGGIILLVVTVFTLGVVNSPLAEAYEHLLHIPISFQIGNFLIDKDLHHFVNDGLMVLFFYTVGLEIKREMMIGELSRPKDAALPLFAALGGMIFPAAFYLLFNANPETHHGWGIPMATDIAFAVGVLTLLGNRVPMALKAFLLAFAIIDDLGAILVIAIFYSSNLVMPYLGGAAAILFVLYVLQKAGLRNLFFGIVCGVLVWVAFLKSGIHATIAGVILAFITPMDRLENGDNRLDHWIHILHPWVAFVIMPLFAFFNAGVSLHDLQLDAFVHSSVAQGVVLGLVFGKPIGILLFCFATVKLGLAGLPRGVGWSHLTGAGFLGGIGFTMSLFIGSLAFSHPEYEVFSKGGILVASIVAGLIGFVILKTLISKEAEPAAE